MCPSRADISSRVGEGAERGGERELFKRCEGWAQNMAVHSNIPLIVLLLSNEIGLTGKFLQGSGSLGL